jgi:hypothetical protein
MRATSPLALEGVALCSWIQATSNTALHAKKAIIWSLGKTQLIDGENGMESVLFLHFSLMVS